jgi:excinuclease UvrABC nuclease subunit
MEVREKVEYLPHSPGVYRFLNEEGTVIYVGKKQAEIIYQHYHNTLL